MIALSFPEIKKVRINIELIALITLGMIGSMAAFPGRYLSASNFLIGVLILPFVFFIQGARRLNYCYLLLGSVFCFLSISYQVKIFYFITIAFYILFCAEILIGKVNTLALFLLGIMSPIFTQVAVILGFPIRLQLSEWAGSLMHIAGLNIEVEGNLMVLNGIGFTVDDACMGLNMLAISLLMGIVVIVHSYRRQQRTLSFIALITFFFLVFLLNIVCNLFRIQILVMFKVLPENPMHEVIGVACLLLYVMVPLYFIGQWFTTRWGKKIIYLQSTTPPTLQRKISIYLLGVIVMIVGFFVEPARNETQYANVQFNGIISEQLDGGITKLYNNNLLIYVKPIPDFFSGEHTPLICWKGSGYSFEKITKISVNEQKVFYGTLAKGNELLHTAWWYTNGKIQTTDQWIWRSQMMRSNDRFCLVNITAPNEHELLKQLQLIFGNKELKINL